MTTPANKVPAGAGQSDEHVEKSLYAKQEKIYPREVHGMFARLRTLGVLGLLGIYYVTPWLRWDGMPRRSRPTTRPSRGSSWCSWA